MEPKQPLVEEGKSLTLNCTVRTIDTPERWQLTDNTGKNNKKKNNLFFATYFPSSS